MNKFEMQDTEYAFPYHWLYYDDVNGVYFLDKFYSRGRFWYRSGNEVIVDKVMQVCAVPQLSKSYLDVGCGDGKLIDCIKSNNEGQIEYMCGCDLSEKAIGFAKAFNPDIDFFTGDFADIQRTFDCITCIETLEHIPDENLTQFIKMLFSKLNRGGTLIITVPTTCQPVSRKHYRHYTWEILKQELDDSVPNNYEVVEYQYMNKEKTSIIMRLYYKLFCGRHSIKIYRVDNIFYKYYKKHFLYGNDEKECIRLLAVLRKIS